MTIKAGDRLPEVALQRISTGVETLDTRTLFENLKVVIFAVPGAFTPTCSEKHLPGFVEHFDAFRERGLRQAVARTDLAHEHRRVAVIDDFLAAVGKKGAAAGAALDAVLQPGR